MLTITDRDVDLMMVNASSETMGVIALRITPTSLNKYVVVVVIQAFILFIIMLCYEVTIVSVL